MKQSTKLLAALSVVALCLLSLRGPADTSAPEDPPVAQNHVEDRVAGPVVVSPRRRMSSSQRIATEAPPGESSPVRRAYTYGKYESASSPYNAVLSCFYRTKSFYHGRATPSFDWVLVFLRSLIAHAANTRVFLWVDDDTFATLTDLTASLPTGFLTLLKVDVKRDVQEDWAAKLGNGANNFRFQIYQRWLEEHAAEVDKVLFSDVTDVAFQADPFTQCKGDGADDSITADSVVFTTEDGRKTFTNEKYNKRWMSCYGLGTVNRLRGKRVSCAGVTIGGGVGMQRYAAAQIGEISKPSLVDCAINRIQAALDQATHNYILHLGTETKFKKLVSSNEKGCVFHGNFATPRINADGVVVNNDGVPFAVLHQYTSNRHPPIMKIMKQKYL